MPAIGRAKLFLTLGTFVLLSSPWLHACGDDADDAPPSNAGKAGSAGTHAAGAGADPSDAGAGGSGTVANHFAGGAAGAEPRGEAGLPNQPGTAGAGPGVDPGAGGSANQQATLCAQFCDAEATTCTGELEQYTDLGNCLAECDGWGRGLEGDTMGNTLDCRIYHVAAAAGSEPDAASTHCPHTGAHPAFFCKD